MDSILTNLNIIWTEFIVFLKLILQNMETIFLKLNCNFVGWLLCQQMPILMTWNPFIWHGDFPLSKYLKWNPFFPFDFGNSVRYLMLKIIKGNPFYKNHSNQHNSKGLHTILVPFKYVDMDIKTLLFYLINNSCHWHE